MKIQKIQSDKYVCDVPNLTIITFDEIFKSVVIHGINILYNIYGNLALLSKLDRDTKKILTHALLEEIYKRMLSEKNINSILYINTEFINTRSEIWEYIDTIKLKQFIIKTCKSISRKVPLPIYVDEHSIPLTELNGNTQELISILEQVLNKFNNNIKNTNKIKKYSSDNGLTHFVNEFHPDDNIKKGVFYYKYLKRSQYEQI